MLLYQFIPFSPSTGGSTNPFSTSVRLHSLQAYTKAHMFCDPR